MPRLALTETSAFVAISHENFAIGVVHRGKSPHAAE
jgi:hypothetical protein